MRTWATLPRGVAALAVVVCAGAASAGDLLVSSRFSNNVLRYDAGTGAFKGVFASGNGLANPNGIAYGPDGNLYVGNGDEGRVLRFDGQSGAYLGDFVTGGAGGLLGCRAIAFGPDGNLYVDNGAGNNVLRYDGHDGHFVDVAASVAGMLGPVGLAFGPNGNLFVGAATSNAVYQFDLTGQFVRRYLALNQTGDTGVLFDSTGRMYVAFSGTSQVLRFNPTSGANLGVFASGSGLNTPIGMIVDPDGNLLVGSFATDSVLKYDGTTGGFIQQFITPGLGGLDGTHNFAYMPNVPGPGMGALCVLAAACIGRGRRAAHVRH